MTFMKNILHYLTVMLVASGLVLGGCATTGSGGKKDYSKVIKTIVWAGTSYAIMEHPEWRESFELAANQLDLLATADTIDYTTVVAIIQALPVKELKSSEGILAITAVSLLLSDYEGTIDLTKVEQVKPIVIALRDGIRLGIGTSVQKTRVLKMPHGGGYTPKGDITVSGPGTSVEPNWKNLNTPGTVPPMIQPPR